MREEANKYSAEVREEAEAYRRGVIQKLEKIVVDNLKRIDEAYKALEDRMSDAHADVAKEHELFRSQFSGGQQ